MPLLGGSGRIARPTWINSIQLSAAHVPAEVFFLDADAPATETSVVADGFMPFDEILLSCSSNGSSAVFRVYMENAPGWNAALGFRDDFTLDYTAVSVPGRVSTISITGRIYGYNMTSVGASSQAAIVGISYSRPA